MKILITGAGGQLGLALRRVLGAHGHVLVPLGKQQLDVTDAVRVSEFVRHIRPDAVIHCAAFTNVDLAEQNPAAAFSVNADGTRHVAAAAARVNAALVYVSTDYVFDGRKGAPYTERDRPAPLGVYGASKLAGERAAAALCERHFIVRTAWLYGPDGGNFVRTVLQRAVRGEPIMAASDQIGSPTCTEDLAEFVGVLLQTEAYGLYHAANRGSCTRYEWVKAILEAAGIGHAHILRKPLASFGLAAPRPLYSALDDENIRRRNLPRFREWRPALETLVSRLDLRKGES